MGQAPSAAGRELIRARIAEWTAWLRECRSLRVWLFYLPGPGPILMSWLRRRWLIWRHPHVTIEFRGPVYLGPRFSLDAPRGGTFVVGPGVEFRRGFRAELAGPEARIAIGGMTVFTYDVVIQCSSAIEIGEHCVVAEGVLIVDGSHRFRDLERRTLEQGYDLRPVTIADHVSVMAKSTVIAGIGERTFVGAGAVVSRPLPAYCLCVGAPARPISYFGPPDAKPPELTEARSPS